MNKKQILIAAVLVLTGCADPEDPPRDGWSGDWVEKNDTFTVNYDTNLVTGPLLEMIQEQWLEVQTCMGLPSRIKVVIEYVTEAEIPAGLRGYINYKPAYIRLRNVDLELLNRTLRHEFIHWILHKVDPNQDTHESPYFLECTIPSVLVTN